MEFGGVGTALLKWLMGIACFGFVSVVVVGLAVWAAIAGGRWLWHHATDDEQQDADPIDAAVEHRRRQKAKLDALRKADEEQRARLEQALREEADGQSN